MSEFNLNFHYAHGEPIRSAGFRSRPSDFQVEEIGITPEGEGEHLYLYIEKEGQNTHWLAEQLADFLGVKKMDVSYSGKKDRHAITWQWFSAYLPGGDISFDEDAFIAQIQAPVKIHKVTRGQKKLRLGSHSHNRFKILLRDLELDELLETRLNAIKHLGVPNYFGEQRFGREGNNLRLAENWASGREEVRNRNLRGMVLSAARSWLFNLVLQRRVEADNWQQAISGDTEEQASGPLWGRGRSLVDGETLELEQTVLQDYAHWCDFLEHRGLQQERRPLRIDLNDLCWEQRDENIELAFSLASGQFATSVLREITELKSQHLQQKTDN